jgi:hypothetical protein
VKSVDSGKLNRPESINDAMKIVVGIEHNIRHLLKHNTMPIPQIVTIGGIKKNIITSPIANGGSANGRKISTSSGANSPTKNDTLKRLVVHIIINIQKLNLLSEEVLHDGTSLMFSSHSLTI